MPSKPSYLATFYPCFLTFTHRFFAAFTIAALPAADKNALLDASKGSLPENFSLRRRFARQVHSERTPSNGTHEFS
jgi:hypothetical protein